MGWVEPCADTDSRHVDTAEAVLEIVTVLRKRVMCVFVRLCKHNLFLPIVHTVLLVRLSVSPSDVLHSSGSAAMSPTINTKRGWLACD